MKLLCLVLLMIAASAPMAADGQVLLEAEGFADWGGWKLDTQFIENMGSP